jgi:hypothetical protein
MNFKHRIIEAKVPDRPKVKKIRACSVGWWLMAGAGLF